MNKAIPLLEELIESEDVNPEEQETLVWTIEAVLCVQTLWSMISELADVSPEESAGYSDSDKVEAILEAVSQIGNELAAAVMLLANADDSIAEALRTMGNNYQSHTPDPKAGAMIKEAHDRLADKVEMTRKIRDMTAIVQPRAQRK